MNFTIGEFNIVCTNLEESVRFYQDVMQFKLITRASTHANLKFGAQTITLLAFAEGKNQKLPYGKKATFSLDVLVENLEEAAAYFKRKGVQTAPTLDKNEGYFAIYDPDMLIWEIVEIQ